jgi:hypothetical protein
MRPPRFRISTLMLLVVIVALATVVAVQQQVMPNQDPFTDCVNSKLPGLG